MVPSRNFEKALKQHESRNTHRANQNYFTKYALLKERLTNVEYAQAMAGFRGGNDHGPQHIERVLDYFDALLGPKPISKLDVYELFLTAMSILYHDVGILLGRKTHAGKSAWLLSLEQNDYVMSSLDKEFMAIAVHLHSSNKQIEDACQRYPNVQVVSGQEVRIRAIAALVRLADELDEDHRRAPANLQQKMEPGGLAPLDLEDLQLFPKESRFFWTFNQRIRGIKPDSQKRLIRIELKFQSEDIASEILLEDRRRNFIEATVEKVLKINRERIYCNSFLPESIQFPALELSLLPVDNQDLWKEAWVRTIEGPISQEELLKELPAILTSKSPLNIKRGTHSHESQIQSSGNIQEINISTCSDQELKEGKWKTLWIQYTGRPEQRVTGDVECAWIIPWKPTGVTEVILTYNETKRQRYDRVMPKVARDCLAGWRTKNSERYRTLNREPWGTAVRLKKVERDPGTYKWNIELAPSKYLYYLAIQAQLQHDESGRLREQTSTNSLVGLCRGESLMLPTHFAIHMAVVTADNRALLRQRRPETELYPLAWEAGIGEFMHGPMNASQFPHFLDSSPSLSLFLSNAVHEELGYDGAKDKDFTLFGFAVELHTLAPKLLVVYKSDLALEELIVRARFAEDYASSLSSCELSPVGVAHTLRNSKFKSWGPTSKLALMLALLHGARNPTEYNAIIESVEALLARADRKDSNPQH